MEKIGDFAKRCEVTIKTLRYYDELGLLAPDFIDPFTGYRYYGADKIGDMEQIGGLKQLGFSLEEIKRFRSASGEGEKLRLINERRETLRKLAADTARQLDELTEIEQKLNKKLKVGPIMDDFNGKFENDEAAVGRWELIGAVERKEDFLAETEGLNAGVFFKEIYFLPGGQQYWIFSWTKGFVKMTSGDGTMICRYELEDRNGKQCMFLYYHDEVFVLKQTDRKRYTKYEIAKCDIIDPPFVNDSRVLGKWSSIDFVENIADFDPAIKKWEHGLRYETAEFLPDGVVQCKMGNYTFYAGWTNGITINRNGEPPTAPAYEIRSCGGEDYLFIEWKSGDYVWGGRQPYWYVFKRDEAVAAAPV